MMPPRRGGPMAVRQRGGPLVMLAVLLAAWCGARVMWWDYPLAPARAEAARAQAQGLAATERLPAPEAAPPPAFAAEAATPLADAAWLPTVADWRRARPGMGSVQLPAVPHPSAPLSSQEPPRGPDPARDPAPAGPVPPPFLPAPVAAPRGGAAGRWSLDSWAFWRQGSSSTPVSQGRVPVYGASQTGAVLQYRLAPSSRHDPRLYARAYRALVTNGESEAALGASLRPLGGLPVRVAGEVRYTDAAFFTDVRPAVYAVTEFPPLPLPFGAQAEVYGQAGRVFGRGGTPFADGQVSLTRELPWVARMTDDRLRLSLGAGAWGGAQRDAQRADVGPTLRLDTRIGQVPARVSVDWRLRVAGDASPGSGVAATVSAGF